jgi:peptidoglycan/LPS O-acetylase OafA/YrhL
MINSSGPVKRIEFIDFAKGYAILGIMLFHYFSRSATGLMAEAIMFGGAGVHLFIIMSGFGLSLSSLASTLLPFYKRRLTRILIPYYVFITLLFIINQFYVIYPDGTPYAYIGHIFWFKMFDDSIIGSFGGHMWFLSVIIQLYLVFPLLFHIKKRIGNLFFFITTLMVTVSYWFIVIMLNKEDSSVFISFFLQYLWEFSGGMILADLFVKRGFKFWDQSPFALTLTSIVSIGLMGLLAVKGGRIGRELNDIPAAIGYTSFTALSYLIITKYLYPSLRAFLSLGKFSYELYLTHIFVAIVLSRFLFYLSDVTISFMESLIIVPFAILVAAMYHKALHPLMRRMIG